MNVFLRTKNYVYLFLIGFAFAATACFNSLDGPQGPPGPPGIDGRDGVDGNANVSSIKYSILADDWVEVGTPGENNFYLLLDLTVPEITEDINESGLVLAYFRANDQDPWTALPFTFISHDPEYTETFDFTYEIGFVTLFSKATDRGAQAFEGTVRLIVAEGIPIGKTEIDYTNFEEVAAAFGLKE